MSDDLRDELSGAQRMLDNHDGSLAMVMTYARFRAIVRKVLDEHWPVRKIEKLQAVADAASAWMDAMCDPEYGDGGRLCAECGVHSRASDAILDALDQLEGEQGG